jgi:hypothetical protein
MCLAAQTGQKVGLRMTAPRQVKYALFMYTALNVFICIILVILIRPGSV